MPVRLTFHGAARTVTGSCYLLETEEARLLVDCGMFQGSKTERELNYRPFPFTPSTLLVTFTPPPLPRPPAWICALTTHTGPPSF